MDDLKTTRNAVFKEYLYSQKSGFVRTFPTDAGWTETVVGTGVTASNAQRLLTRTGVNINSSALRYIDIYGLNRSSADITVCDWAKKLFLFIQISALDTDAQVVRRFQIKQANTIGDLAARGIGIQLDNLALSIEGYGASRGTASCSTTLTSATSYDIILAHYGSLGFIECYVNGSLVGTLSTSGKVPTSVGNGGMYLVQSVANGAAGGVDAYLSSMNPITIWQES